LPDTHIGYRIPDYQKVIRRSPDTHAGYRIPDTGYRIWRNPMARIAILYCRRIKDHSCIACAKCYKGMAEGNAEFGRHDEIELVAMTDCGDCPGLLVPRVKLLTEVAGNLERSMDVLHLGTCVKLAMETGDCPVDLDTVVPILENKFGIEVVLGTHGY
jgi:predicted metal-binding protein